MFYSNFYKTTFSKTWKTLTKFHKHTRCAYSPDMFPRSRPMKWVHRPMTLIAELVLVSVQYGHFHIIIIKPFFVGHGRYQWEHTVIHQKWWWNFAFWALWKVILCPYYYKNLWYVVTEESLWKEYVFLKTTISSIFPLGVFRRTMKRILWEALFIYLSNSFIDVRFS